jgi:hypothetical protein
MVGVQAEILKRVVWNTRQSTSTCHAFGDGQAMMNDEKTSIFKDAVLAFLLAEKQ